jgi:hypothetical protein
MGKLPSCGIGLDRDHHGGAFRHSHCAGCMPEHARAGNDDVSPFEMSGVTDRRRHGRSGAVGGCRGEVGHIGRHREDRRSGGEMAVFGVATEQFLRRGAESLMAELAETGATGMDPPQAALALAAGPEHGPRDAIADLESRSIVVPSAASGKHSHFAGHLVTRDARGRPRASASEGMQITATNRGTANADEGFASREAGQVERLDPERRAWGIENGSPGSLIGKRRGRAHSIERKSNRLIAQDKSASVSNSSLF